MPSASTAHLLLVRDTTPEVYETMSDEQRRAALDRWNAWVDGMVTRGKLQSGHPLGNSRRLVAGGAEGRTKVVDGPFTEAKELVGGFFLLTDTTLEEATEIARRCPLLDHGMTVEIGPIVDACHLATELGWQTMRGPAVA